MPPDAGISLDGLRWFRYAEEDLASARLLLASLSVFPKQSCYHAQQAAEKSLKALLIARKIVFPKTHDLLALARLLTPDDASVVAGIDLGDLTTWVVTARYPMDPEEATASDAHGAIGMVDILIERIRIRLAAS